MAKKYLKLSENLKKLLFEKDMKPVELARELELPQPTIHRLVTGKSTRPYQSSLEPIAQYFHVTVAQLIGEEPLIDKKLKENTNLSTNHGVQMIPLFAWEDLAKENKQAQTELIVGNISEKAFALVMPDYSMEPLFQKGSILIFDPEIQPSDRSYVLVKLKNSNTFIFRQILIDVDQKFIKPLNPDISVASMRLLNDEDEIIACLIETRNNFQPNIVK